jgi:protein-disulfide isomerase
MKTTARIFTWCALPLILTAAGMGQDVASVLKPPKGAKMAIVVFEDLQCPECARTHPVIGEAAKKYKIPVVTYDYPLPMHNWSYKAALIARYFETQSNQLGSEFRDAVFKNQQDITPQNLQAFAEKFAHDHNTDLPFAIDPQGKLAAAIQADKDLGTRVGLNHTPTIYVVTSKTSGTPYQEVADRTQLFATIDRLRAE